MGQFSWDSVVLSRDVKGKGFGETCGSSRVSGRAELPVSDPESGTSSQLSGERNFQLAEEQ